MQVWFGVEVPDEALQIAKENPIIDAYELWNADPNCEHDVTHAQGGGYKCTKCSGWLCY